MDDFLLSLVGVPYKKDGRTPEEGFDCYTLVVYCLEHEGMKDSGGGHWQMRTQGEFLPRTTSPLLRFDCLLFAPGDMETWLHVGICRNSAEFLHASSHAGQVTAQPISRYPNYKRIWRPRLDSRNPQPS